MPTSRRRYLTLVVAFVLFVTATWLFRARESAGPPVGALRESVSAGVAQPHRAFSRRESTALIGQDDRSVRPTVQFRGGDGAVVRPRATLLLGGGGVLRLRSRPDDTMQCEHAIEAGSYSVRAVDLASGWESTLDAKFDDDRPVVIAFDPPSERLTLHLVDPQGSPVRRAVEFRVSELPTFSRHAREAKSLSLGFVAQSFDVADESRRTLPWAARQGPDLEFARTVGACVLVEVKTDAGDLSGVACLDRRHAGTAILQLRPALPLRTIVEINGKRAPAGRRVRAYVFGSFTRDDWTATTTSNGEAELRFPPAMWLQPVFTLDDASADPTLGVSAIMQPTPDELGELESARSTGARAHLSFRERDSRSFRIGPSLRRSCPIEIAMWVLGPQSVSDRESFFKVASRQLEPGQIEVILPALLDDANIECVGECDGTRIPLVFDTVAGVVDCGPTRAVKGRVVSTDGGPLVGASVCWAAANEAQTLRVFRRTQVTAEPDGSFSLVLPAGVPGVLRIAAEGHVERVMAESDLPQNAVVLLAPHSHATICLDAWISGAVPEQAYLGTAPFGTAVEAIVLDAGIARATLFAGPGRYQVHLVHDGGRVLAWSPVLELRSGCSYAVSAPPVVPRAFRLQGASTSHMQVETSWSHGGWRVHTVARIDTGVALARLPGTPVTVVVRVVERQTIGPGFAAPGQTVWEWTGNSAEAPSEIELAGTDRCPVRVISAAEDAVLVVRSETVPLTRLVIPARSEDVHPTLPSLRGPVDVGLSDGLALRLNAVPREIRIEYLNGMNPIRFGSALSEEVGARVNWTLEVRSATTEADIMIRSGSSDPRIKGPAGSVGFGRIRFSDEHSQLVQVWIHGGVAVVDLLDGEAQGVEEDR